MADYTRIGAASAIGAAGAVAITVATGGLDLLALPVIAIAGAAVGGGTDVAFQYEEDPSGFGPLPSSGNSLISLAIIAASIYVAYRLVKHR